MQIIYREIFVSFLSLIFWKIGENLLGFRFLRSGAKAIHIGVNVCKYTFVLTGYFLKTFQTKPITYWKIACAIFVIENCIKLEIFKNFK